MDRIDLPGQPDISHVRFHDGRVVMIVIENNNQSKSCCSSRKCKKVKCPTKEEWKARRQRFKKFKSFLEQKIKRDDFIEKLRSITILGIFQVAFGGLICISSFLNIYAVFNKGVIAGDGLVQLFIIACLISPGCLAAGAMTIKYEKHLTYSILNTIYGLSICNAVMCVLGACAQIPLLVNIEDENIRLLAIVVLFLMSIGELVTASVCAGIIGKVKRVAWRQFLIEEDANNQGTSSGTEN